MINAVGTTRSNNMTDKGSSEKQSLRLLINAGLKADNRQLKELANRYHHDPLTLSLLAAYLKRWYAGRLNGLETIPVLLPKRHQPSEHTELDAVLTAFETKLNGASDLTLLYLLSLSDRPVPHQHMKTVFRSTLMERWLTRRDDYVHFLGPLGRLNEEHWQWVIENLRRLHLLEQPIAGQHDLLFVAEPIRQHFSNKLRRQSSEVFKQAKADMQKLFQDTVVEFKQRYYSTPEIKTMVTPELRKELDAQAPKPVLWKEEELKSAQSQLKALRDSLETLKTQTKRLADELGDDTDAPTNNAA